MFSVSSWLSPDCLVIPFRQLTSPSEKASHLETRKMWILEAGLRPAGLDGGVDFLHHSLLLCYSSNGRSNDVDVVLLNLMPIIGCG